MAKGGNFELKVAKKLSLWFSGGKNDGLICRTDSSGGRATTRNKANKTASKFLYGDLKHSDEVALPMFEEWSIECKTGYARKNKKSITKWDILDLIDSTQKEAVFLMMWNQCQKDAKISNREPILIFGRNLRRQCIALNKMYFDSMIKKLVTVDTICLQLANDDYVIIMGLNDFLEKVFPNPESIFGRRKKK